MSSTSYFEAVEPALLKLSRTICPQATARTATLTCQRWKQESATALAPNVKSRGTCKPVVSAPPSQRAGNHQLLSPLQLCFTKEGEFWSFSLFWLRPEAHHRHTGMLRCQCDYRGISLIASSPGSSHLGRWGTNGVYREDEAQLNSSPSWCSADPGEGKYMGFPGSNADLIIYRGKTCSPAVIGRVSMRFAPCWTPVPPTPLCQCPHSCLRCLLFQRNRLLLSCEWERHLRQQVAWI